MYDPCDWDGGIFDGETLLELSGAQDDWPKSRPFQEDGHLSVSEYRAAWARLAPGVRAGMGFSEGITNA